MRVCTSDAVNRVLGMRRERIDLRVTKAEKEKWMKAADSRGLDLSEMIRRAISHYLKK